MTYLITPEVFWSRVAIGGPSDCWDYIGPAVAATSGHLRCSWRGKKIYSHRLAFFLTHGVWPLLACHRCDRPSCCNPDHLYSGTPQENVNDREARNRRTPGLPRRPLHWSSKLSQLDLDQLAEARLVGIRVAVLAAEWGVSASTIRAVWRAADQALVP